MKEWWPLIAFALLHGGLFLVWIGKTGSALKVFGEQITELRKLGERHQTLGEKMVELGSKLDGHAFRLERGDRRFDELERRMRDAELRLAALNREE
jgi:hypothetical protein